MTSGSRSKALRRAARPKRASWQRPETKTERRPPKTAKARSDIRWGVCERCGRTGELVSATGRCYDDTISRAVAALTSGFFGGPARLGGLKDPGASRNRTKSCREIGRRKEAEAERRKAPPPIRVRTPHSPRRRTSPTIRRTARMLADDRRSRRPRDYAFDLLEEDRREFERRLP